MASRASFAEIGVEPGALRSPSAARAFDRRRRQASLCHGRAVEALSDFGRGAHVFGVNKGQFSAIDLCSAVLELTGPADVSVWTWCIADYEVQAVTAFLGDGRIQNFRLVMDWAGAQRDMPLVGEMQARFGLDCLRVTKTHAKLVTVATPDGWRIVVRGSMNLNANKRFEQFDVCDDPAIYSVVRDLEDELWRRGKPLPARELKHDDATRLLDAGDAAPAAPAWAPQGRRWF